MKKLLKAFSLVLALVMCFACISVSVAAAETKPSITLFGNESTPAEPGSEVSLILRLADFTDVVGADITVTLPEGMVVNEVSSLTATETGWKLSNEDTELNYKIDNNAFHVVDVFNIDSPDELATVSLEIKATANSEIQGAVSITATLVNNDENIIEDVTVTAGQVVVLKKKITEGNTNTNNTDNVKLEVESNYFVPYGSVYYYDESSETYTYYEKTAEGSFEISNGATYSYQAFPLPGEEGLTTFGVSAGTDGNVAIQFGTYVTNRQSEEYGTLIILGDWDAFVNYYKVNKGYTEKDILDKLVALYDKNVSGTDYTHFNVKAGDSSISVYKSVQSKYMWRESDNNTGVFEYAARVVGITADQTCTGVGYKSDNGSYTFSKEIKTATYNKLIG